MWKKLSNSIFAGVLIGLAAYANSHNPGIIGAILFSFGLLSIVLLHIPLFTGRAGISGNPLSLVPILICNWIGVLFVILLLEPTKTNVQPESQLLYFAKAILCGLIIDVSCHLSQKSLLPILIGVPLFVLCGFKHCIAEVYNLYCADISALTFFKYLFTAVAGNYIGCNIRRILS